MQVVNRYGLVSHWLVGAALFVLLVRPTPIRSVELSAPVQASGTTRADTNKDLENPCVTLVVRGMMKSKSGAT